MYRVAGLLAYTTVRLYCIINTQDICYAVQSTDSLQQQAGCSWIGSLEII
jgi:hypothetical protein